MSNMIAANVSGVQAGNVVALDSAKSTEQPKDMKGVIAQLTEELTKSGKLDESSPLGKMVADHMPFKGLMGDSPGAVQKGVENLIKDKLGENFGAAQSFGGGGGGGGGAAGVAGGGSGQQDLMSQVLNALSKSMLGDVLKDKGEGTTFDDSAKNMMSQVGEFMDANPGQFPKPDSGSWKTELSDKGGKEKDNFLDGDETQAVRAALDMLGGQLDAKSAGTSEGVQQPQGGQGGGNTQGVTDSQGGSQGGSVDDLKQLLESLLSKLEGGNGQQGDGVSEQLGDMSSRRNQQTLDSSASQAADALVQALLQGSGSSTAAMS